MAFFRLYESRAHWEDEPYPQHVVQLPRISGIIAATQLTPEYLPEADRLAWFPVYLTFPRFLQRFLYHLF